MAKKKKSQTGKKQTGSDSHARWREAGWPGSEINLWRRVFRLEEAIGWRDLGVEWAEAVRWHQAGVTPEKARTVMASGVDAASYVAGLAARSPVRCRQCGYGMVQGQHHECR